MVTIEAGRPSRLDRSRVPALPVFPVGFFLETDFAPPPIRCAGHLSDDTGRRYSHKRRARIEVCNTSIVPIRILAGRSFKAQSFVSSSLIPHWTAKSAAPRCPYQPIGGVWRVKAASHPDIPKARLTIYPEAPRTATRPDQNVECFDDLEGAEVASRRQ